MGHIPAERLKELALRSVWNLHDTSAKLTPPEAAHMQDCSECIEIFVEAVREAIKHGKGNSQSA